MNRLIDTAINSLQELVGGGIKLIPAFLTAVIILLLTRYLAQATGNIAQKIGDQTLKSRSLRLLVIKVTSITTWVVGTLFAAVVAFPGLNLGDIIATLGLSSVAIGFAFQDIFKNFLAGTLLLIQEPFKLGDQIIVGDYEGTVERVDIRTTTIRTYQGEEILLPNSDVFTSAVQVRTAFDRRRTDLAVGVDYNTPLSEAIALLQTLLTNVEGVLDHPVPEIDIVEFGDSSINFLLRYWTPSDQGSVRRTQTRVMLAIKAEFDRANITIPYPIRTLYFYNQDQYSDYQPKS
ncbi:mechanosensitive ion channel family protein [Spirulina major]|uniref:mechanosensitive ion channel family protein n=1 Tax=Spirulina major TaxID=270636 RepID=UPI000933328B|nr:mechanosensitive ion channel family protein [Spirulina major]